MATSIHPEGVPIIGPKNLLLLLGKKNGKLLRKQLVQKAKDEILEQEHQERYWQMLELTYETDYSKHFSKPNRHRTIR